MEDVSLGAYFTLFVGGFFVILILLVFLFKRYGDAVVNFFDDEKCNQNTSVLTPSHPHCACDKTERMLANKAKQEEKGEADSPEK